MLNIVRTKNEIANLGFMSMTDYFLKISANEKNAVYGTVRNGGLEVSHSTHGWPPP